MSIVTLDDGILKMDKTKDYLDFYPHRPTSPIAIGGFDFLLTYAAHTWNYGTQWIVLCQLSLQPLDSSEAQLHTTYIDQYDLFFQQ